MVHFVLYAFFALNHVTHSIDNSVTSKAPGITVTAREAKSDGAYCLVAGILLSWAQLYPTHCIACFFSWFVIQSFDFERFRQISVG